MTSVRIAAEILPAALVTLGLAGATARAHDLVRVAPYGGLLIKESGRPDHRATRRKRLHLKRLHVDGRVTRVVTFQRPAWVGDRRP